MTGKFHIFSTAAKHTTSQYFRRAIAQQNRVEPVCWDTLPDINTLSPDDVLFIVDPVSDWPIGLERRSYLTVGYLIDVHLDIRSRLLLSRFFDAVFIAQKDYVRAFQEIGHNHAYWLPLACDPEIHCQPSENRMYQVGFVGQIGQPGSERHRILSTVLPRYHTNDYRLFYTPIDMSRIYGQSKIVFNASINKDLNMRFFEALASGALLVSDRIENGLKDLFEEGVHYVGYSSVGEAIEKIDYYLVHSEERQRIAAEGQHAVLASHTYTHRWNEVMQKSTVALGQAPVYQYDNAKIGSWYSEIFVTLRMPWRIPQVMLRYGPSLGVTINLFRSIGRWVNARIPLTPNAIKARIYSK
jgi:hypothetical protein